MKLEVREIASAMVGPGEPVVGLQAPSHSGVTLLAQRIPLRDVLEEMQLSEQSNPDCASGAKPQVSQLYAASTVVALPGAQGPVAGPILIQAA
ncbi:MAG: hypothetical protein V4792_18520 [Pseudomonadota bacterium]